MITRLDNNLTRLQITPVRNTTERLAKTKNLLVPWVLIHSEYSRYFIVCLLKRKIVLDTRYFGMKSFLCLLHMNDKLFLAISCMEHWHHLPISALHDFQTYRDGLVLLILLLSHYCCHCESLHEQRLHIDLSNVLHLHLLPGVKYLVHVIGQFLKVVH